MTIDELGLKPRTLALLKNPIAHYDRHRLIHVPADVAELSKQQARELLKIARFGRAALKDLVLCLRKHGYDLEGADYWIGIFFGASTVDSDHQP